METRARLAAVGFWASNGRPCFSLFLMCTLFGGGREKNETRFHMRTPKKERGITQGFFTIASKPNAFLCVFSFSLSLLLSIWTGSGHCAIYSKEKRTERE